MGVISSEKYTHTLKSLANPRVVAVFFLRFSSGLPLALSGGTLQAWLTVEGVDCVYPQF
jgi:PAT family beta-lactamase induction signal transducer AmpG